MDGKKSYIYKFTFMKINMFFQAHSFRKRIAEDKIDFLPFNRIIKFDERYWIAYWKLGRIKSKIPQICWMVGYIRSIFIKNSNNLSVLKCQYK